MNLQKQISLQQPGKPKINVKLEKELGKGGYGTVYLIQIKGKKYALKIVDKSKFSSPDSIQREVKIIQKLLQVYPKCKGTPNLLCYKDIYEDKDNLYFVSDLMDGELFDYIESNEYINLNICDKVNMMWKIMTKVLFGLETLHRAGIIHRDIKGENILFQKSTAKSPIQFKISDFGLSCFKEECGWGNGTLTYLPPQSIFGRQKQTQRDDFYALGVILFIMISGYDFTSFQVSEVYQEFDDHKFDYSAVLDIYETNYKKAVKILDNFEMKSLKNCSALAKKKVKKMIDLTKYLVQPNPREQITIEKIKEILQ
jgi:serine/threonine protein kinase